MANSSVLTHAKILKGAQQRLANSSSEERNGALYEIGAALIENSTAILAANAKDIENGREEGLSDALIDRLFLSKERLHGIKQALEELAALGDPLGETLEEIIRPNGLRIVQVRVPIGAIGIVYEGRPNVTVDAAAICVKTGNCALLRGSSYALESNRALMATIHEGLSRSAIPTESVALIEEKSRESVTEMLHLDEYLDAIIPRGSGAFITYVRKNSSVPVIETGAGNCHLYLHQDADREMAISIAINAKTQRPSVCNAIETILVHREWPSDWLQELINELRVASVEVRGCDATREAFPKASVPATEDDYATEFLTLTVAMRVVDSLEEAVTHINKYGTKHSEAIVTADPEAANHFLTHIDAAAVYHNASTRFTDGGEFGFGAEIGISTQKLHARGPMGLRELTSYQYRIYGEGQVRA